MKDFTVNDLFSLMDVEVGTTQDVVTWKMKKVFPSVRKQQAKNPNIYFPKHYVILPTGYMRKKETSARKKLLKKRYNIVLYEIEVMITDAVSDGYWALDYLNVTRDYKLCLGRNKLQIK